MIKQWSLKLYDDFVGSGLGWGASVPVAVAVVVLAGCSWGADEVAGGFSGAVSGMTTSEVILVICPSALL